MLTASSSSSPTLQAAPAIAIILVVHFIVPAITGVFGSTFAITTVVSILTSRSFRYMCCSIDRGPVMSAIFTSAFTLGIITAIHAVADVVVCPAIVARALLLVCRCGIPGGIIFGII
jgi:hypothetical protein